MASTADDGGAEAGQPARHLARARREIEQQLAGLRSEHLDELVLNRRRTAPRGARTSPVLQSSLMTVARAYFRPWATSSARRRAGGSAPPRRSRSGCGRRRSTSSSARSTSSARAGRCASRSRRDRVPSMILYGPPGLGQDDARAHRRADDRRRLRGALGRLGDRRERARGARPGTRAAGRDSGGARSSSSTRSTASTRRSRTRCCRASRKGS